MEKLKLYIIPILIICLLGFLFHRNNINELPSHTHAWAQADHYALAIGFTNNHLNFFKPETFALNHQFPDDWHNLSKTSITAVDFPIHDFIPALIMKITGSNSPFIFRLYILVYSFLGLYFLFKISLLITNNFYSSIAIIIFAATSPLFVYYQSGFLPTIPSLSNAIIGIYFYVTYLSTKLPKHFKIALLFLTLAALSRTTFAITLLSVIGVEFICFIKEKQKKRANLVLAFLSLATIFIYFLYNNFLRANYGSIFLNHFLPAHNLQEAKEVFQMVSQNWLYQYFSATHYIILGLMILTTLVSFFLHKKTIRITPIALLIIIMFAGCMCFTFLMLLQFPAHDYYFLDTFFLPISLLAIILISKTPLPSNKTVQAASAICFILLISFPLVSNAFKEQENRYKNVSWDRTATTISNYNKSNLFLDSLNIPEDAKILLPESFSPNLPFILMKRKGAAVMPSTTRRLEEAMQWDCDYSVIENDYFINNIFPLYPSIINHLTPIANNGKITVCKFHKKEIQKSLLDFIGNSSKKPLFKDSINFELDTNPGWENINTNSNNPYSGKNCGITDTNFVYSLTFKKFQVNDLRKKNNLLYIQGFFNLKEIKDTYIGISVNHNGTQIYSNAINIAQKIKQANSWQKLESLLQLPEIKENNAEFGIYIFNPSKNKLYIDDLKIEVY